MTILISESLIELVHTRVMGANPTWSIQKKIEKFIENNAPLLRFCGAKCAFDPQRPSEWVRDVLVNGSKTNGRALLLELIRSMFTWSMTAEGLMFWSTLYKMLKSGYNLDWFTDADYLQLSLSEFSHEELLVLGNATIDD